MKSRVEKLLVELIALPSVNPAFLPAGDSRSGEQKVADFLATRARRAGLDVELQRVLPGRSNLLARMSPERKTRETILLAPHLDTVNAEESQFRPRVRGDRIFGRGACDTKGSVAAMFSALCELAESGARPKETEIVFAGLIDEEHAQAGSRALAASGLKADLGIVGEATRLEVVTAHKGSLWLRLETHGRAAHGSRPELGRNAVYEMARVISFLENEYARQLRRRKHPLLGSPSVSLGVIQGGTQTNIVPDYCEILVDRRTVPGETEQNVHAELRTLLRRRKLDAVVGNGKVHPSRSMETDPSLPLVQQFLSSAGARRPAGAAYYCDGAVLVQGGIPCIVFGPGDIAQAHTSKEWISVKSLRGAAAILGRFLRSLP